MEPTFCTLSETSQVADGLEVVNSLRHDAGAAAEMVHLVRLRPAVKHEVGASASMEATCAEREHRLPVIAISTPYTDQVSTKSENKFKQCKHTMEERQCCHRHVSKQQLYQNSSCLAVP